MRTITKKEAPALFRLLRSLIGRTGEVDLDIPGDLVEPLRALGFLIAKDEVFDGVLPYSCRLEDSGLDDFIPRYARRGLPRSALMLNPTLRFAPRGKQLR